MRVFWLAGVFCLFLAPAPCFALFNNADFAYVKKDATAAQVRADDDACIKQVLAEVNSPANNKAAANPAPRTPMMAMLAPIARTFDMSGPHAAFRLEVECMARLGYVRVKLTDQERKEKAKLRNDAQRDQWLDRFLASDWSNRPELPLP